MTLSSADHVQATLDFCAALLSDAQAYEEACCTTGEALSPLAQLGAAVLRQIDVQEITHLLKQGKLFDAR